MNNFEFNWEAIINLALFTAIVAGIIRLIFWL